MQQPNEAETAAPELSRVLIALFQGVVHQDAKPELWQSLLKLQARVRDYVAVLGLELVLDEAEGYAYLQQHEPAEGEAELPRLIRRRQLSFPVSLLLALLRKRLAEHDASAGDTRLVLTREQIVDLLRVFMPDTANEARLMERLDSHIKRVEELGFVRRLKHEENSFEVRRILKAFVDAQWLGEFEERLATYRQHLSEQENDG
ncbi:DUF4194 domain-containing protein [Halorhodospira halochloris]|uniref:DUF4194 domain-containing protein n=1 Tax=Halorhodospira halochloris TaxID=1052 RepID=UPI001EE93BF9|nr:DUF4194 domain-containing protein [Halorhodospira halochloris]MCG5529671.1 DUF4194 domain-containing protein [Halorhodospira halochloris]